MAHPPAHPAAPQESPAAVQPGEVWRLVAPWLGYVFLAAAAILGLFTASGAPDSATYAVGLVTFALAAILIVMRMNRQLGGGEVGFLLAVSARSIDELFVTIAVLAVLGLVGMVLAATVGGTVYAVGLALFAICAALIFYEIKRYFDARERGA